MSVRLQDIAKELGVSTSTVSKALNDRPGVSEKLKSKILQTINDMDFRPKQRVGGLIKDETVNVNLLVRINKSIQNDPFYSLITEGISNELQNCKSNLLYYVLNDRNVSDSMFTEIFENKDIDGNIFVGADFDPRLFDKIHKFGIPTVLVDNMYPQFSTVNTDNFNGSLEAIEHLVELGHKNIMFLSGPLNHNSLLQRYQGYEAGLKKFLKGSQPKLLECKGVSVDDGYDAVYTDESKEYTAIFAATDKLAIGALKALKDKKIRIPEDMSIIGFDDIEWGLHTDPSLTTVRTAKHQIGVLAAQLLLNLYNRKDVHEVDIKVASKLIKRGSTNVVLHKE